MESQFPVKLEECMNNNQLSFKSEKVECFPFQMDICLDDIEIGDDIFGECSDSDLYFDDFGSEAIASDFSLFEAYCDVNNIIKTDINMPYELDEKKVQEPAPSSSPFDTQNFPTSVNDISTWLDSDKFVFIPSRENKTSNIKKSMSLRVPEVIIKEVDNSASEESEEDQSREEEYIQPPLKRQRLQTRKYSSTDSDSDEDWDPESVTSSEYKEKNQMPKKKSSVISSCRKPNPVPQRRAPGTKQKITQWIVGLLRDPRYNPKVLTWLDEKSGMFQIKDTATYAKLWGKYKGNPNMTYEKLSRAMRYSYKNQELHMVPELRLTYKFGRNMVNFRAADAKDPNFEKIHSK